MRHGAKSLCSRNARPQKALLGRMQLGLNPVPHVNN
jgi:hypothetical protein